MNQVEIPNSYFYDMSKKDYSQFETALVREFFQNSVDAGATEFLIDYRPNDNLLTITDNGSGMNEDTVMNKLLVMGESFKNAENATGAFGHAKILLYFSWATWTIRTQDLLITGSSHYYTIEHVEGWIDGCISTIHTDSERHLNNFRQCARSFFMMCDTKCVAKFREADDDAYEVFEQELVVGENIFSDDDFDIFKSSVVGWYIIIRQNGIYMFKEFISANDTRPMAVVEIKREPFVMFLQSRDQFKTGISDKFNELRRQLTSDHIDTFKTTHDKNINNYTTVNVDVPKLDGIEDTVNRVLCYQMSEEEAKKTMDRLRSKRLLNICYSFKTLISEKIKLPNIVFGFTNGNHDGMCRFNSGNNEYEVYINLNSIVKYSPNYRQMSIILLNIVKHELAHVITKYRNGSMSHDEDFVKAQDNIHDTFWDSVPFTNKFKSIWKGTK